jgi:hypothetical protein
MKIPTIAFISKFMTTLLAVFLISTITRANGVINDLNYLGTSGLFFVPSGSTIDYGEFHYSQSNMVDVASYSRYKQGDSVYEGNARSFATSPFPGIEIGMSNMGYDPDKGSDLIANIKYSPTFIPKNWFDVAVGAIDLGGETGMQRALYAAVSKEFDSSMGEFRLTLGSGSQRQQQTIQRYKGGFAGIEYQPFEWLTAVAEHDGVNNHYGIKLHTPASWLGKGTQLYGSALLQTDIDQTDTRFYGVGIRTSLFSAMDSALDAPKQRKKTISKQFPWLIDKSRQAPEPDAQAVITENIGENLALQDNLEYLRRALIRQGFESVWVTENNGVLSVGFENTIFNRNEIDALGVAMGLAAQVSPSSINFLDITLSKYGVKTLRFRLSLLRLKEFYANNAQLPPLQSLMASDTNAISQAKISNSGSYLIPRVILTPKVRHFMGTELGMLDYSIALRSTVELPLWSGGVLYGDYDYQLTQTEDFERGKSFYRWSLPSRWSNFAFKQMLQMPLNIYTSVGLGRFKGSYNEEYDGIFAETFWQSPSGAHSVSYSGGYYDSRIYNNERQMGVGRYRYYWQALDLSISYEAGQYWRQDKGSKLEFAFNFGDTKAHFYLQDTDHQLLGFGFSMPLAARKDRSPSRGQLRATNAFYVNTSTMINSDSGCNCLVPGRAQLAPYSSEIASQYFNNDRLNINYIHANQQRLREAFFDFVKQ